MAEIEGLHADDHAILKFAKKMREKMRFAREERGRGGWMGMSAEELSAMLRGHVEKGDPVDVANFCMMLSANGASIAPVTKPVDVAAVREEGFQDAVKQAASIADDYIQYDVAKSIRVLSAAPTSEVGK